MWYVICDRRYLTFSLVLHILTWSCWTYGPSHNFHKSQMPLWHPHHSWKLNILQNSWVYKSPCETSGILNILHLSWFKLLQVAPKIMQQKGPWGPLGAGPGPIVGQGPPWSTLDYGFMACWFSKKYIALGTAGFSRYHWEVLGLHPDGLWRVLKCYASAFWNRQSDGRPCKFIIV